MLIMLISGFFVKKIVTRKITEALKLSINPADKHHSNNPLLILVTNIEINSDKKPIVLPTPKPIIDNALIDQKVFFSGPRVKPAISKANTPGVSITICPAKPIWMSTLAKVLILFNVLPTEWY